MRFDAVSVWLMVCACAAGCGDYRGIPTHGGGKRFDEEQRIIAGAIRQTLADLELHELAGKKVHIEVECIANDGGGVVSFPGVQSVGVGANGNIGSGNLVQIVPAASPGGPSTLVNDNSSNNLGGNAYLNYSPQIAYSPTAMATTADVAYFHAALDMKARHVGLMPAGNGDAEAILYVLVDVLGTNRSKKDRIVTSSERLVATCECTYYAVDPKTNKLIFEARRASAESVYSELHTFGDKDAHVSRSLFRTQPSRLPIDEPEKPTTMPTTPFEVTVEVGTE
jgi:hypothetical protein